VPTTTLPKDVRVHPNGRSYQARPSGFPPKAGFPLTPEGLERADDYARECRRRRRQGILVPPADRTLKLTTLADVAEEYLEHLRTVGGKHRRPYSESGLEQARKSCRPWLGIPSARYSVPGGYAEAPAAVNAQGHPFGLLPLAALDVRSIELYLERRSAVTPRAATGEAQALQSILKLAARRGDQFDQALLTVEPLKRRPRKQRGISAEDLTYFAGFVFEHSRRLFLLGKTLGSRIMELLLAEDAWFDLDAGTVTIPAKYTKEKRTKVLDLLPEEIAIIREQRLARSAKTATGPMGTPLLFPRKNGSRWTHSAFWEDVVKPARRKASKAYRAEHDLPADAETPFEYVEVYADTGEPMLVDGQPRMGGLAPHDLRRCAATTLKRLKVPSDLIAARLGHADDGELVDDLYDTTEGDPRREALAGYLEAIDAAGGTTAALQAIGSATGPR